MSRLVSQMRSRSSKVAVTNSMAAWTSTRSASSLTIRRRTPIASIRTRRGGWETSCSSLRPTGYVWGIPAGPMTIRYTAVIKDGAWLEVGDRIMLFKEPVRFFEMNLKRVSDSNWPAAGAVPPK